MLCRGSGNDYVRVSTRPGVVGGFPSPAFPDVFRETLFHLSLKKCLSSLSENIMPVALSNVQIVGEFPLEN